jgi:DNA-binding GntR family transcriptional regulator
MMDDETAYGAAGDFFARAAPGDSTIEPIARRHLHDELLERLRDSIISGELAPGSKIPEKELCDRYGVSRTPLREALKVLAYEGLVVLHHNRGASVSALTLRDLEEVFPIYASLEALAGEMACERLSDKEIAAIRALHEEMVGEYRQRNLKRHFEINEAIHERIHAGSRNETLSQLLRNISSRIRRARIYANIAAENWAGAIKEHEEIIAALEARHGARLAKTLRGHMEATFRRIKQGLAQRTTFANHDSAPFTSQP